MNIFGMIGLIFRVKGEVSKLKPGFMTTEFWITVINILGMILGAFLDKIPVETALIIGASLSGLYIIARAIVKKTETTADDAIVEAIYEKLIKLFPQQTVEPK